MGNGPILFVQRTLRSIQETDLVFNGYSSHLGHCLWGGPRYPYARKSSHRIHSAPLIIDDLHFDLYFWHKQATWLLVSIMIYLGSIISNLSFMTGISAHWFSTWPSGSWTKLRRTNKGTWKYWKCVIVLSCSFFSPFVFTQG